MRTTIDLHGRKDRIWIDQSGEYNDAWWAPDKDGYVCFRLGQGSAWSVYLANTVRYVERWMPRPLSAFD